ncbi:MAG: amino acid adenylation domain-containing protein, partial [Gemmatimonadetes bacterium]|nr:amino acid adenylation domain-containing protein [Gemmatimonadota bacterium]
PLSFAQQRLWFLDQLEPGSAAYNLPYALRLRGRLDEDALERSIEALVARHETLRTRFPGIAGQPRQVIDAAGPISIARIDLSQLDGDAREAELRALAAAEARTAFDLAAGPLFRCTLVRLGDEENAVLFTLHHIVSDGWSTGVLVREVSALYGTLSTGRDADLPALPVQYADFAAWQRSWLSGDVLDAQLGWWRQQLAGAPPMLELPTDRPRPRVQGGEAGTLAMAIPARTERALRELSRREGGTLFMTLLAAWQLLLSKYAGQDDVSVGTPVAGRTRVETEGLIGFFVNTLVLRTDLSGDPSFRALLARVRETTLGAQQHQEIPFERLVEALAPERSLASSPLFQAMLVLQNNAQETLSLGALQAEAIAGETAAAQFDLNLALAETDDGLAGLLTYRAELWDAATMERMLAHFAALLDAVTAAPDLAVSRISLLGDEERARLDAWNATEREFAAEATLAAELGAQAARTPDAVAVVFADEALTYVELDRRANRLANHLVRLGAGPEARVGICLERSAEMVVAMLAVLKAGAAYLPLDPSYPAERLAYMLEDSGAPLLVTEMALRGLVPAGAIRVVSVDEDAEAIAASGDEAPATVLSVANAAYVIYTSGSTGRPKGVQVTHANAVAFLAAMDERVGGPVPGTWLAVTRISFDIHVLELLWTLARGFKVVVQPEPERARDGESVAEQIRRHGVTHLQCTPSLAAMLTAEAGVEALAGVERILLGGEALPAELAAQITAVRPDGLVNLYGPTETTVWSATHAVSSGENPVAIGRPIANTRIHVVDAALARVPAGVPGELLIGGAGVTRGYLGRPSLTAERFVPDPFSATPGARLYRTGDRARWTAAGELEYLGRLDFQVKVRGFRIELGEIEAALRIHPSVRDAAVLAREDAGESRIVAYLLARDGDAADAAALKENLKARLPEYMVPAAFVALDAFPLTPNGKLDRRALPAPAFAAEAGYVAPRTATEAVLAELFAGVLRTERVGAADDFFALGGHSLLATRLVSRVRDAFQVELPVRALFEAPTVSALAARVDALRAAGVGVAAPPLVPAARTGEIPLSFAQQRLWFLDQLEPGSAAYNLPYALRLRGALDEAALERSIATLVARHETLRTRFPGVGGRPLQVIDPAGAISITRIDLSDRDEADREAELRALAAAEARTPFDLAAGPLFRCTLVKLADEENALLFTLHHIVSDGWSTGVLVREVSELYAAYSEGTEPHLPPLPVQYADFAAWQRAWLTGDVLDAQLGWWRGQLAGAPPMLELPTDRPRPRVMGDRGGKVPFALAPDTARALLELSRREGATLFMTALAAWQLLLSKYAGQDDVSVGTPIAGRTRLETEGLIGFFVNTLVLRTDLSGDPSFRALLARVRETTLGAHQHQDIPFERLVEALSPERSLGSSPLFQAMLVLQNNAQETLGLGALHAEAIPGDTAAAQFDLQLSLAETGDGLAGLLTYRAELWDAATMERMAAQFAALLDAVTAAPELPVSRISLLGDGERASLAAWNATDRDYALETSLPALFQAQAARTPDAVAVTAEGEALTYGELDARANRLARHLRT